jgi:hypothetical protein
MEPKNENRRIEFLALLDGTHRPPPGHASWTARALAEVSGISLYTALHLVRRQRLHETIRDLGPAEGAGGGRGRPPGELALTDKGRARLAWFGGHARWCPLCLASGRKR